MVVDRGQHAAESGAEQQAVVRDVGEGSADLIRTVTENGIQRGDVMDQGVEATPEMLMPSQDSVEVVVGGGVTGDRLTFGLHERGRRVADRLV